jgi:hypothetical protein
MITFAPTSRRGSSAGEENMYKAASRSHFLSSRRQLSVVTSAAFHLRGRKQDYPLVANKVQLGEDETRDQETPTQGSWPRHRGQSS